jgi:hypothetical protein
VALGVMMKPVITEFHVRTSLHNQDQMHQSTREHKCRM